MTPAQIIFATLALTGLLTVIAMQIDDGIAAWLRTRRELDAIDGEVGE